MNQNQLQELLYTENPSDTLWAKIHAKLPNYYTYLWLREDGTPYYVGKGHGDRAYRKGCPSRERIIVQDWPSENAAFSAETFLIAYYGRKDLGTGCLRNRTAGGEGVAGHVKSAKEREGISKRNKGNKHCLGRSLSLEHRTNLSAAGKGNKNGLGYRHSANARAKMSIARAGRTRPKSTGKRISEALLGHRTSLETREKISRSQHSRLQRKKNYELLEGSSLLITGGTGFFGQAMAKRALQAEAAEVRIFSRDEYKQEIMRREFSDSRLKFYIGDVREPSSLRDALRGVDNIFHASAMKQVPSCEFFPFEAVRTNILGSENVFTVAQELGIKKVVAMSTDKAVYPVGAMGLSKALMEKLMVAKARSCCKPILCGTRYGNVMASRGSVIPLFIQQIKMGKPITVTNPEMTRFLMSVEEALDLVMYAFQNGRTGDIFVKKAPASTILVLAEAIKELLGASNEIKIIGTRHGEKVYETLVAHEEMSSAEDCGDYFRLPSDARDMNYAAYFSEGTPIKSEEYSSHNTTRLDKNETIALLMQLNCIKEELCGSTS
jgi:UDP-glucose 4-epimerase